MIRILLVDDQPLVRAGLARILGPEDDMEIVGECADGDEVPAAVAGVRPDVVLYEVDGHPTEAGSYLAACVVLRVLYGTGTTTNTFTGDVDDDVARHLQEVAATQPAT